jgi:hypothetical protein
LKLESGVSIASGRHRQLSTAAPVRRFESSPRRLSFDSETVGDRHDRLEIRKIDADRMETGRLSTTIGNKYSHGYIAVLTMSPDLNPGKGHPLEEATLCAIESPLRPGELRGDN